MFESGLIYANEGETMFRAEDIINKDRHFAALQYAITECIHSLSGRHSCTKTLRLRSGFFLTPRLFAKLGIKRPTW